MKNFYENKDILITGGCGSIGSEIVRQLLKFNPQRIRIFDQNEAAMFNLEQELKAFQNVRYLIGSVRDKERLRWAIKGVDIIFHAAALKHVPLCEYNPVEAVRTNVLGTQNLIDAAREENVDRVIAISTDKAVNPINTMGATKLLSEKLILAGRVGAKRTKFSCVRFGNVLNSSGSVIPIFTKQIQEGGPITITSKEMTRFIMSIHDAVYLVLQAAQITGGGEIIILKMKSLRIIDLAEVMINELSPKYGYKPSDIKIKTIGIRPGEKLHELLISEEDAFHLIEKRDMYILSPGFQAPHDIDRGITSKLIHINNKKLLNKMEIKKELLKEKII
jgi:FlaA1/EpsC-like NDP-sugar epimerase